MRVAWVCEYPASTFTDRPALRGTPSSHAVPWVTVQAPSVAASGVELHIVTVSKHIAADDAFVSGGVHFHFLKVPPVPRAALAYQLDRARIWRCLERIRPDVVHGFGTESSFGYSAVTSSFPSLLMIQGIVDEITRAEGRGVLLRRPGLLVSRLSERVTVKAARHVVCETEFAARWVHRINPAAHTHIVRTPISDRWFDIVPASPGAGESEILFVGSLVPAKGVDVLVEAFGTIAAEFPDATLHLVGAGPAGYVERELKPAVDRLNLSARVHFHGALSPAAVAERVAHARVMALPTLMDTAPNVVAEARAAGVPVVASRVGGIPELIDDGQDGVLVPPRAPGALAGALSNLLRHADIAATMGGRGRARVQREHRLSTQVPLLLHLYQQILSQVA